jgi:hypothetical protein
MGIDSLKSGISSVVSKVQQTVAEVKAEVKTAVAPPPAKPKEAFVDTAKKPISITGKFQAMSPAGTARADLSASVSSLRMLANSGLATNAIGAGGGEKGSINDAINEKSDTKIRELVNADPSVLKNLSPQDKGRALEALRSGWTSGDDQKAMVAIVRSCETKGELKAVLQAAAGGTKQADMHKFDKQMTGEHPYLIADLLNPDNTSLPEVHPASIGANEHVTDAANFPAPDGRTLDLKDPASRKAFLEGLTQVDSTRKGFTNEVTNTGTKFREDDEPRQYGCGPTCILASALQGNDPKGSLLKLCDHNLKNVSERNGTQVADAQRKELQALRSKISSDQPLTRKDFDLLQRTTYESARAAEKKFPDAKGDNGPIDARAIKVVLEESGVGTSGGTPRLVDTDRVPTANGGRTSEHFVLEKDGAIYDPWPRKQGTQTAPAGSESAKRYQESFVD